MKPIYFNTLILLFLIVLIRCSSPEKKQLENENIIEKNPPASGFNISDSDEEAIRIADKVMEAMGGRKAWDNTRCLEWNFFGARKLLWDKADQMLRVDYLKENQMVVLNLKNMQGSVSIENKILINEDSIKKYTERAYRVWINDSYWLVMPFKLKDSGVTLKYIGPGTSEEGKQADILQLTFSEVGVTPQNKYHVWVDQETNLVCQWAFFRNYDQADPDFINPWLDYQKKGDLLLSGNRGQNSLTEIEVYDKVMPEMFTLAE